MGEHGSARVFVAIGVGAEVADAVARLQHELGRGSPAGVLRWVNAEQAHVTLRFLGQRSSEEQELIARAASAAVRQTAVFALGFGGLGVFPDERRPHTLWIGMTAGRAEVAAIAARLDVQLASVGFAPEERPFVPHLTLARIKHRPPAGLIERMLGRAVAETPLQTVDSIELMESRPGGAAVRYVPLCSFRLENPCTPSK